MAAIDVTDETFQTDVIDKSAEVPVVVDLWAPWCGPCKTLGPIIEKVIDETGGKVVLVKVNIDENPGLSQAFKVQSIPAVYAVKDGAVVDGFMGSYPEHAVKEFVDALLPTDEEVAVAELLDAGDEGSLRIALSVEPANEDVIVALAELLIAEGNSDEALALLARIPESDRTRHVVQCKRSPDQRRVGARVVVDVIVGDVEALRLIERADNGLRVAGDLEAVDRGELTILGAWVDDADE